MKSKMLQPRLKHLLLLFISCIALANTGITQKAVPQTVNDQLRRLYFDGGKKEIPLEQFIEVNRHVFEKKNDNAAHPKASLRVNDCSVVNNVCGNGDFESGAIDLTQWKGGYGTWTSASEPTPLTLTEGILSGSINSGSAHQTVVTQGVDPVVPIPQVAPDGGRYALRIGNSVTSAGIEFIAKTITVTPGSTIIPFRFALVFEDPGHALIDQPAFSVRAFRCDGTEIPNICNLGNGSNKAVSNRNDPFFTPLPSSGGNIVYRNWSTAQINLSGHIGETITLVFLNKDCNLGAHFGYTYIDNLCAVCTSGCPYNVRIDPTATDTCGTGRIRAIYNLPQSGGFTGTTVLSLAIYQNGVQVGSTISSPTLATDTSYTFPINPGSLGLNASLGGFDYVVTGNFTINGFPLAPLIVGQIPNGQRPNQNNDYLITCPITCDLSSLSLGPDKSVNLFYADSGCTKLAVSGLDSTDLSSYKFVWSTGDTSAVINVCPTATTTYTLTVTKGSCTFADTVKVNVSRCPNNIVVLAPSCSGKATISWTEPRDTFPNSISIPTSLDAGAGTLSYIGGLDGHGYYKSANSYLWPVARDISSYLGGNGVNGHLATLTTAAENSFIHNRINGTGHSPWIGLYNTGRPGRFRWVTNEALGYTNWAPGEPNNSGGNPQNVAEPYVHMVESNGTWNDWSNNSLTFITEFEKPLIRYRQISGPNNGSERKVGVYLICYERTNLITDQKDTCCFTVTVTCNGPFSCPQDTIIVVPSCSGKATISWTEPRDTFPNSISIPTSLDAGAGTLSYIGGLDGHGYYKSANSYLWPVARDISSYLGGNGVNGHLATLTTAAENSFVTNNKGAGYSPWIGLYNTGRPGRFRWLTNEALGYTNWAPGEPNNSGGNPQNVAEPYVHLLDNGTWNDWSNNSLTFITEFEKPLIRYKQIAGPNIGSEQTAGVYLICYERTNLITDQKDTCCFTVTITCNANSALIARVENAASSGTPLEMTGVSNSTATNDKDKKAIKAVESEGLHVITYPNPSYHVFTLSIKSDDVKELISVQVVDAVGRIIETKNNLIPNLTLQVGQAYKPGIYFVQIIQGAHKVRTKLIKQAN